MFDGGVEHPVRNGVAHQEVLQTHQARVTGRSDQHRSASPGLDQSDPAQDQGPHDALAELSLGDHQPAQAGRGDDQGFELGFGADVDEGGAARKLAHFGDEVPLAIGPDQLVVPEAVAARHVDPALQHHRHAESRLAGPDQIVARGVAADLPEPAQPIDLEVGQREVHLLPPGSHDGRCIFSHGDRPWSGRSGTTRARACPART